MLEIIDKCDTIQKRRDIESTICCMCNTDKTSVRNDGFPRWYKCVCSKENCTGYYCHKCYMKKFNVSDNGIHTITKNLADCRTGNLDRLSYIGKEIIGQWICAKTLGIKDLNIENDNLMQPVDLSNHHVYGEVDVKTCTYYKGMCRTNVRRRAQHLAILCMEGLEIWKDVKKVYIIPEDKIKVSSCLTVYSNPLGHRQIEINRYYEKFIVDNVPYNETYHGVNIPMYFNPWNLWKGIYDIQRKI